MNSPEGPEVGGDFDDEYLATLVEQCEGMGGEDDLIAELAHEVRRMRAQPCPHVVTGDEGTAYCDLAESSVRALRERLAVRLPRKDRTWLAFRTRTGLSVGWR